MLTSNCETFLYHYSGFVGVSTRKPEKAGEEIWKTQGFDTVYTSSLLVGFEKHEQRCVNIGTESQCLAMLAATMCTGVHL